MQNNSNIFEALRSWRREASIKAGIPPYFILSNQTLTNIADFIPETPQELLSVRGIGEKKLEAYGQEVLGVIIRNKTPDNQRFVTEEQKSVIDPETGELITIESKEKKESKHGRIPTHHISFYMLMSGMTISEIAEERGIQEHSVEEHLCTCIEERKLNALSLIPTDLVDQVEAYHVKHPDITSLKEIFLFCKEAFPYSSIRFAVSHLKSSGEW